MENSLELDANTLGITPKRRGKLFLKAFPLAPQFYFLWFAWSSSVMYINWMVGYTGCYYFALGSPKWCFHRGNAQCSKKTHWWANEYDSFKKPEAEFFESSWQNQNQSSLILKVFPWKKKKPEILSFLNFSRNQNQRLLKNNHPTLVQTMGRRLTFNSQGFLCVSLHQQMSLVHPPLWQVVIFAETNIEFATFRFCKNSPVPGIGRSSNAVNWKCAWNSHQKVALSTSFQSEIDRNPSS